MRNNVANSLMINDLQKTSMQDPPPPTCEIITLNPSKDRAKCTFLRQRPREVAKKKETKGSFKTRRKI